VPGSVARRVYRAKLAAWAGPELVEASELVLPMESMESAVLASLGRFAEDDGGGGRSGKRCWGEVDALMDGEKGGTRHL